MLVWENIGHANNVVAMTHGKGEGMEKLFSTSLPPQNKLYWVNPSLGQENWRWCKNCQGLWFGGSTGRKYGFCPAGFGTARDHVASDTGHYKLVNNDPSAPGQDNWRWCKKCQGLFFAHYGGESVQQGENMINRPVGIIHWYGRSISRKKKSCNKSKENYY